MSKNQSWLIRLNDQQLSFWRQKYPSIPYYNKQILWIQQDFKNTFDNEIQSYPEVLTTDDIKSIGRIETKLTQLEQDYLK